MTGRTRRPPTGAAVLQPQITSAISEAVLDELAERGYGRLSMEAVARRAGVGKSALYRRWPRKQDMVLAVLSQMSVPLAEFPDTGSLRGDLIAGLAAIRDWLTHPRFVLILPDLTAEAARNPVLAEAIQDTIGTPRRQLGSAALHRAVERGELPADLNLELALDLLAAPIHWRLNVRQAPIEPGYLEALADHLMRALGATEHH
ncbi:TetR/AcrR family transcriptional regulator [Nonomuraea diastatica]|uniref:TetR/AcrR family transcriptional regulator n=1 Tax=Nonomuraea diastatica TaxID=1848329 RepID=A0A4R4WI28_9ACTN|nr:TetR/AcrR family transcriptional regulator [Nonomuraea diastatica]TDD17077.1 TetR/AcrR family transcriptional regulator [Nonomuraea diastatica]